MLKGPEISSLLEEKEANLQGIGTIFANRFRHFFYSCTIYSYWWFCLKEIQWYIFKGLNGESLPLLEPTSTMSGNLHESSDREIKVRNEWSFL
jgi:hypothetical protein